MATGTQGETRWKPRLAGNEVGSNVRRRYEEVNGGRLPFQIIVDRENGVWEVGPFGPGGANVQFGSLDADDPFAGSFSALVARSLRPGVVSFRADDDEESNVAGPMSPRADAHDYDGEVALAAVGTILHLDGPCARVRIIVDTFDPGAGGDLACWVL